MSRYFAVDETPEVRLSTESTTYTSSSGASTLALAVYCSATRTLQPSDSQATCGPAAQGRKCQWARLRVTQTRLRPQSERDLQVASASERHWPFTGSHGHGATSTVVLWQSESRPGCASCQWKLTHESLRLSNFKFKYYGRAGLH